MPKPKFIKPEDEFFAAPPVHENTGVPDAETSYYDMQGYGDFIQGLAPYTRQSDVSQVSYWNDPTRIARYYLAGKSVMDAGKTLPPWLQTIYPALETSYKYLSTKNAGKQWYEWGAITADDPLAELTANMTVPPIEALPDWERGKYGQYSYKLDSQGYIPVDKVQAAAYLPDDVYQQYIDSQPGAQSVLYLPREVYDTMYGAQQTGQVQGVQDYANLPADERLIMQFLSTPWAMAAAIGGVPMATALGSVIAGGTPASALILPAALMAGGLGLGYLSKQEMEAGKTTTAGVFSDDFAWATELSLIIDGLAEGVERTAGFASQLATDTGETLANPRAAWKAAHLFYEAGGSESRVITEDGEQMSVIEAQARDKKTGVKHKYYMRGLNGELYEYDNLLDQARERIKGAQSPQEVAEIYMDIQNQAGAYGAAFEAVGHILLDPLNVMGDVYAGSSKLANKGKIAALTKKIGTLTAGLEGLDDAAKAAKMPEIEGLKKQVQQLQVQNMAWDMTDKSVPIPVIKDGKLGFKPSGIPMPQDMTRVWEQSQAYGTLLRATVSDPGEIAKMGAYARAFAGVVKDAAGNWTYKDMLPPPAAQKGLKGLAASVGALFTPTPMSRAQKVVTEGTTIWNLMVSDARIEDMPAVIARMTVGADDLSKDMTFMKTPGGWALSKSLQEGAQKIADFHQNVWASEASIATRKLFGEMARILGYPNDADAVYKVLNRCKTVPEADAVLRDVVTRLTAAANAGDANAAKLVEIFKKATPESLVKVVNAAAKGEIALDEHAYKAHLTQLVGTIMEKWASGFYGLKPDAILWKFGGLIKSAQSLALLGVNPFYPLNNWIWNASMMAYSGTLGFTSQKDIATWNRSFGAESPRAREGIGVAGEGGKRVESPMGDAVRYHADTASTTEEKVGAWLDDTKARLTGFNQRFGLMSRVAQTIESRHSEQVSYQVQRRSFENMWHPGKGFDEMPTEMADGLRAAGVDPQFVYSLIEHGLNMEGIAKAIYDGGYAFHTRNLDAPTRQLLTDLGMMDDLTRRLQGAKTREDAQNVILDVFQEAGRKIRTLNDETRGRMAEEAYQRVLVSGFQEAAGMIDDMAFAKVEHHFNWMMALELMYKTANEMDVQSRRAYKKRFFDEHQAQWEAYWLREEAVTSGIVRALTGDAGENSPLYTKVVGSVGLIRNRWGEFFRQRGKIAQLLNDLDTVKSPGEYQSVKNAIREEFVKGVGEARADELMAMDDPWDGFSEFMCDQYRQATEFEDGLLLDMDDGFVEAFIARYPQAEEAIRQWRDTTHKFRRQMVAAQMYFRHGDSSGLGALPEGAALKADIDRILSGKKLSQMSITESDRAWKKFHEKIYLPLTGRQYQATILGTNAAWQATFGTAQPQPPAVPPVKPQAEAPAEPVKPTANEPVAPAPQQPTPGTWERKYKVGETDIVEGGSVGTEHAGLVTPKRLRELAQKYNIDLTDVTAVLGGDWSILGEAEVIQRMLAHNAAKTQADMVQADAINQKAAVILDGWQDARDGYREGLKQVLGLSDAEADDVMVVQDAWAEYWGQRTGKPPETYWKENIGRITSEPSTGDLLQVQQQQAWYYSQLQKTIEQKMPSKASPDQIRGMIRGLVKEDELAWTGFNQWLDKQTGAVSKQDAIEYLELNQIVVRTIEKKSLPKADLEALKVKAQETGDWSEYDAAKQTKYDEYTVPGGKNYREVLLTFDAGGGFNLGHWSEKNVLVHFRLTDRVDANGKKVLFIEEIQSDWHQKGRKYGYTSQTGTTIPDAPFSKSWEELAIKRITRYAAEQGYDSVAWVSSDIPLKKFFTNDDGAGMRAFYDEMLPSIVKKYIKRWNGEVRQVSLPDAGIDVKGFDISPQMRTSVMSGQPLFQKGEYGSAYETLARASLYQAADAPKAAVSWLEDGRAVIHALNKPDVSSAVHEFSHVWLRSLTREPLFADDLAVVTTWLRGQGKEVPDDWAAQPVEVYRDAHETFARASERYFADGIAPKGADAKLIRVFESLKRFMLRIYKKITGSAIDVPITPELRQLFDKWTLGKKGVAVEAEPVKPIAPDGAEAKPEIGKVGARKKFRTYDEKGAVDYQVSESDFLTKLARRERVIRAKKGLSAPPVDELIKLNPAWKDEYKKLVKKAISKGLDVPQDVIDQYPEFVTAKTARERYEKGFHTSFANKSIGVDYSRQATRGFKAKRQDGKLITPEQMLEIETAVGELESIFGDMSDLFAATDITLSHTNGKMPFLASASGMYHPSEKTVTFGWRDGRAFAHEVAHWLDYETGKAVSGLEDRMPIGNDDALYRAARKAINKEREIKNYRRKFSKEELAKLSPEELYTLETVKFILGPYWTRRDEVFARLVEQYVAFKKQGADSATTDSYSRYVKSPGYWKDEDFVPLVPLIEEAIQTRISAMRDPEPHKSIISVFEGGYRTEVRLGYGKDVLQIAQIGDKWGFGVNRRDPLQGIQFVPEKLFSSKTEAIEAAKDALLARYKASRDISPDEIATVQHDMDVADAKPLPTADDVAKADYWTDPAKNRRKNADLRANLDQMTPDELKATVEQLRGEVYQDELTGLPNVKAWAEAERLPVAVVLDVRGLKKTNDTYGMAAGDDLLRAVAQILQRHGLDGEVYHLHGDEFVMQFDSNDAARAAIAAALPEVRKLVLETGGKRLTGFDLHIGLGNDTGGEITAFRVADDALRNSKAGKDRMDVDVREHVLPVDPDQVAPKADATPEAPSPHDVYGKGYDDLIGFGYSPEEAIAIFEQGKASREGQAPVWKQKRDDFVGESYENVRRNSNRRDLWRVKKEAAKWHEMIVRQALKDGEIVPPEVLADYPDLAAEYAPLPDALADTPLGKVEADEGETVTPATEPAVEETRWWAMPFEKAVGEMIVKRDFKNKPWFVFDLDGDGTPVGKFATKEDAIKLARKIHQEAIQRRVDLPPEIRKGLDAFTPSEAADFVRQIREYHRKLAQKFMDGGGEKWQGKTYQDFLNDAPPSIEAKVDASFTVGKTTIKVSSAEQLANVYFALTGQKLRGFEWKIDLKPLPKERAKTWKATEYGLLAELTAAIRMYKGLDVDRINAQFEALGIAKPDGFDDLLAKLQKELSPEDIQKIVDNRDAVLGTEDVRNDDDQIVGWRAVVQDDWSPLPNSLTGKVRYRMLYQTAEPGRVTATMMKTGKDYDFRYRVVSLDDLIASHDIKGKPNPRHTLNPREREGKAYIHEAAGRAAALDPKLLLTDYKTIADGTPIIGDDMLVESGNGRTISMLMARQDYPERWRTYQTQLRETIGSYGLDASVLDGVKDPVLVRERITPLTPEERKQFVADANESGQTALSDTEIAAMDAQWLTPDIIRKLDIGDNETLVKAVQATRNEGFFKAFLDNLPPSQRGRLVGEDGKFTEAGLKRIQNALIFAVYGKDSPIGRVLVESGETDIKTLGAVVYETLPQMADLEMSIRSGMARADLSIAEDVTKSFTKLMQLRIDGLSVSDYLKQSVWGEAELTDFQRLLLAYIDRNLTKKSKIVDVLRRYTASAKTQPVDDVPSLFAEPPLDREAIFRAIVGKDKDDAAFDWIPKVEAPDLAPREPGEVARLMAVDAVTPQMELWNSDIAPRITDITRAVTDNPDTEGSVFKRYREGYKRANPNATDAEVAEAETGLKRQVKGYLAGVDSKLKAVKFAATRHGDTMRDFTLNNYGWRFGFDKVLEMYMPYQFFYTRSLANWGLRMAMNPQYFSHYMQLSQLMEKLNRDDESLPSRLRGKLRIPTPWLPDWMGDSTYIDPLKVIFPFHQLARPLINQSKTNNVILKRTVGILQQWSEDEEYDKEAVIEAIRTRSGDLWERAKTQATQEIDDNPGGLIADIVQPSLPIQLATTPKDKWSQLPATRFAQNIAGAAGYTGVVDAPVRKALGMPERDEYSQYAIDQMLANLAAENPDQTEAIKQSMITQSGEWWDKAVKRAGNMGARKYVFAFLSADMFPEGEQEQRALKKEYDIALKKLQAGDRDAYDQFFEAHPEYEAQRQAWNDPEARLHRLLISEVWKRYLALNPSDKDAARTAFGDMFDTAFLNKETRAYDAINDQTLASWAKALGGAVPDSVTTTPMSVKKTDPAIARQLDQYYKDRDKAFPGLADYQNLYFGLPEGQRKAFEAQFPQYAGYQQWRNRWLANHPDAAPYITSESSELAGTSANVQNVVYTYRAERDRLFPGIDALQSEYYAITDEDAQKEWLKANPTLKQYWEWKRQYNALHPEAAPYIMSDESLSGAILGYSQSALDPQILGAFSAELSSQVLGWAVNGETLGGAARSELERVWNENGQPGGTFEAWLALLEDYLNQ